MELELDATTHIIEIINKIKEILYTTLVYSLDLLLFILRPLYVILLVFGLIKLGIYGFTYKGRSLLISALILAVFSEVVLPLLVSYLGLR
ncbi:MAG: hypothetical protein QXH96_01130 [Candidatus Geothermarchaeota archaeon]